MESVRFFSLVFFVLTHSPESDRYIFYERSSLFFGCQLIIYYFRDSAIFKEQIAFCIQTLQLMRKHFKLPFVLCIALAFWACAKNAPHNSHRVYRVAKKDFQNSITASGFLEAEQSKSISAPQLWTNLKVLYIIEEGTYVYPGDTVCILEALELETNFKDSEKGLEIAKAEYNKTEQELLLKYLMLESQVEVIETITRIKQLDSAQQNFVTESDRQIINLEIKRAEIEREKILTNLRFLKKINESELRKTKLKIQQAENNVNRTREKLEQLVIVSKDEGLVQLGENWQTQAKIVEGDNVWGNQPLVNLPDLSKLQVKLIVSETYFKRIAPEQKVAIQVDADSKVQCTGKVLRKAPAGRPVTEKSPVKVYDIFVQLDSAAIDLTPGLSVTCKVLIEELTDTLLIPLTAIHQEDSMSFVLKKENRNFIKTPIKTANQSDIEIVVTEGLSENDIITINYTSNLN